MPKTMNCERCAATVRFEEEDRGSEVYCHSCGAAVRVPANEEKNEPEGPADSSPAQSASAPPAPKPKPARPDRASIFGGDVSPAALGDVVRSATCPACGQQVPVRLEDIGGTLYCPACGAGVEAGPTLGQREDPTPKAPPRVVVTPPASGSAPAVPASKGRSRWLIAGGTFAALALAGVVFVLAPSTRTKPAGDDGDVALGPAQGKGSAQAHAAKEGPQGKQDGRGPATKNGVSPAGSGERTGQAGAKQSDARAKDLPEQDPLAEITLAAIEGLLAAADAEMVLVQAQVWLQILVDHGVAESDPRQTALNAVIAKLEAKLNPPPKSDPPYVAEFAALLTQFQEALLAQDLRSARRALEKAEPLFEAHPADLARYSQRFMVLRERLRELEAESQGAVAIENLLDQADAHARAGEVTLALLAEAKAKFQTQHTPLDPSEHKRIDERARTLVGVMDLARGRRALQDAERCFDAKDRAALDRQLDLAKARLAGLPESSIRQELDELKRASDWTIADKGTSAVGQEIEFRALCEAGIEQFGRGPWPSFIDACVKAREFQDHAVFKLDPAPYRQLLESLWETLETKVGAAVARSDQDPELLESLIAARQMLKDAEPWNAEPVWRKLDLALATRSAALAANELQRARDLAAVGKYADALAVLEKSRPLAAGELVSQAQSLADEWRAELQLQKDLAATDKKLAALATQAEKGDVPGAYAGLARLRQRFPDSPRQPQMQALEQELRHKLDRQMDDFLTKLEEDYRSERWESFRRGASQLETLPLAKHQEPLAQALIKRSKEIEDRAVGIFVELGPRAKMLSEDDTVFVLGRLREAVRLAPENEQIMTLWEKAKGQGERRAQKLVASLAHLSRQPDKGPYRKRLERILALDPAGPAGAKAKVLLAELLGSGVPAEDREQKTANRP